MGEKQDKEQAGGGKGRRGPGGGEGAQDGEGASHRHRRSRVRPSSGGWTVPRPTPSPVSPVRPLNPKFGFPPTWPKGCRAAPSPPGTHPQHPAEPRFPARGAPPAPQPSDPPTCRKSGSPQQPRRTRSTEMSIARTHLPWRRSSLILPGRESAVVTAIWPAWNATDPLGWTLRLCLLVGASSQGRGRGAGRPAGSSCRGLASRWAGPWLGAQPRVLRLGAQSGGGLHLPSV